MAFFVLCVLSVLAITESRVIMFPPGFSRGCDFRSAVDLGRVLNSDSLYLQQPFTPGSVTEYTLDGYTYRLNSFCSDEHVGTHINAPYQYNENGWTVDQIPLHHLIGNAVFMNLTTEVAGNSSFLLEPHHIKEWVRKNGQIPKNAILLISFGWSQYYSNKTKYLGTDSDDIMQIRQPAISLDATRMLINMKRFVGIVLDTLSIDVTGQATNRALTTAENIYNVEQAILHEHCLHATGYKIFVMPMKINGTGAPARVIAVPFI